MIGIVHSLLTSLASNRSSLTNKEVTSDCSKNIGNKELTGQRVRMLILSHRIKKEKEIALSRSQNAHIFFK
jgi:hypothetical protein